MGLAAILCFLHRCTRRMRNICRCAPRPVAPLSTSLSPSLPTTIREPHPKECRALSAIFCSTRFQLTFCSFSVFGFRLWSFCFVFYICCSFFFISLRANNQFFSLFAAVVVAFAQGRRWLVLCLIIKKNRNDDVIVIIVVAAAEVVVSICIALRAFSHLAQLIAFYDHSFSMQSRPISRRIRAQVRLRIRFRI